VEQVLWMELYRMLEQVQGEAARLRPHVDASARDRLNSLEHDIQECARLVQGLLQKTPASAAYLRLVGLSAGD